MSATLTTRCFTSTSFNVIYMWKTVQRLFRHSVVVKRIETFVVPQPGEGVAEVFVTAWHARPGDTVTEDQLLCQARSDKGVIDYKSDFEGVLKEVLVPADEAVEIGGHLYRLDVDDQKYPLKVRKRTQITEKAAPKEEQKHEDQTKVLATPECRNLAKQLGLELALVLGTGEGGRVRREDVLAAATPSGVENTEQVVPLNPVQRAMARTMTEALSIPLLTLSEEVYMDNLILIKDSLKSQVSDLKLTFMPFFMKALSHAVSEFPIMNSVYFPAKQQYQIHTQHNISFAMDTQLGLIVPNIKNCQDKSILDIAKELKRIQSAGSTNQVAQTDISGGTIALSNIGTIGGTYARPIVLPPQVFIGALGSTRPRLEFRNGIVVDRSILYTSWSADHRFIDGATTARFVQRWKQLIEDPSLLLLTLK